MTALSVIPDVGRTISSALLSPGNELWLVGTTKRELGGSALWKARGELGACVPRVDAGPAKATLDAVWRAIQAKTVVAAHDLSEGSLGVALAEMAIALPLLLMLVFGIIEFGLAFNTRLTVGNTTQAAA